MSRSGAPLDLPVSVRLTHPAPPDPNVGFPYGPDPIQYDTAQEGQDFSSSPRSVTIPAWEDETEVTISVIDDDELEALEAFTLYVEEPVPGQDNYAFFADPANPPATKPGIGDNDWNLERFSLNFANDQNMIADDGESLGVYDWYDDDADGTHDDASPQAPAVKEPPIPVSYARTEFEQIPSLPQATPRFTMKPGSTMSGTWIIEGEPQGQALDAFTFEVEGVGANGRTVSSFIESEIALPSEIKHKPGTQVKWTVWREPPRDPNAERLPRNQLQKYEYGTTSNDVFVTGAEIGGGDQRFVTVVEVGTRGADGLNPLAQGGSEAVFDAIWDNEFKGKQIKPYTPSGQGGAQALKYELRAATVQPSFWVSRLLATGQGQCDQWTAFHLAVLKAQGISNASAQRVDPKPGFNGFSVEPAPAQGVGMLMSGSGGVENGYFSFHSVVRFGDRPDAVYDTAYGRDAVGANGVTAEVTWEADNVKQHVLFAYDEEKEKFVVTAEIDDDENEEDLTWI